MKRKAAIGVTLLEILLVLAIAAMIIVMSIRYYQNASQSQQANMAMEEIQAIAAAADNLAIGSGSYATQLSTATLTTIVGSANMITPTGAAVVISGIGVSSYNITMPLSLPVCMSVATKISANSKIGNTANCTATGVLTYTYNNSN